jgi:hypothetical protein
MCRRLFMFTVGALALTLTLGSPVLTFGHQAESESDTSGPAVVPTATVLVSAPTITVRAEEPTVEPAVLAQPVMTPLPTVSGPAPEALPPAPIMPAPPLAGSAAEVTGPAVIPTTSSALDAQETIVPPTPAPTEVVVPAIRTESPEVITAPAATVSLVDVQSSVLAQGFVEFAMDEVVWRAVRYEADTPTEARFDERPLGFVLATDGAVVLVDQASSESTQLAPGQAAFVRDGTMQQRVSQSPGLVQYLVIELVSAASADDAPNGVVLYVSEPFVPSPGRHGLVLARHLLSPGRVRTLPDTGERNLLFVLEGVAVSQSSGGLGAATLAADEGTVFRGTWEASMPEMEQPEASGIAGSTIVVASIGAVTAASALPPLEVAMRA